MKLGATGAIWAGAALIGAGGSFGLITIGERRIADQRTVNDRLATEVAADERVLASSHALLAERNRLRAGLSRLQAGDSTPVVARFLREAAAVAQREHRDDRRNRGCHPAERFAGAPGFDRRRSTLGDDRRPICGRAGDDAATVVAAGSRPDRPRFDRSFQPARRAGRIGRAARRAATPRGCLTCRCSRSILGLGAFSPVRR